MEALIDVRNENLWTQISKHYTTSFEESINGEYSCFAKDKSVIFYIDSSNPCKDSFTHEMLHVYLRMNECFMGAGLKNTINQSNIISSLFPTALLEHMGNCLDHIKMLPIYLNMGFNREKFILDYSDNKCNQTELNSLKKNYKIGKKVNKGAVHVFVGKIFAIKAYPNENFDYSAQLSVLKKLDPILFSSIENLITEWEKVDIESSDIILNDYHSVLFNFYDNLKKWLRRTKFN